MVEPNVTKLMIWVCRRCAFACLWYTTIFNSVGIFAQASGAFVPQDLIPRNVLNIINNYCNYCVYTRHLFGMLNWRHRWRRMYFFIIINWLVGWFGGSVVRHTARNSITMWSYRFYVFNGKLVFHTKMLQPTATLLFSLDYRRYLFSLNFFHFASPAHWIGTVQPVYIWFEVR